jgi:pilus assembly protein CpaB
MRNRIFAVLAIAVLAGGGLAMGTYNFISATPAPAAAAMPTQSVVVAAADLSIGTAIERDHLRVIPFPEGAAPEGSFSEPEQLVGRGVVSPLVRNEPVLAAKLASKEAGAGLSPVIPEGMRAVSVRVNEVISVAGYVLPGNSVDVIATQSPTNNPSDTVSKVVLANVQVLTAGTRIEQETEGKPVSVTVVTLLVSPEQAERLALASTEGKIQLALRNPIDRGTPVTSGIKPSVLMGVAKAPVRTPASSTARQSRPGHAVTMETPAPPPVPTVEIIRGDKRATEVIK